MSPASITSIIYMLNKLTDVLIITASVNKVLEADDLFARPPDEESGQAWDTLLPREDTEIRQDV